MLVLIVSLAVLARRKPGRLVCYSVPKLLHCVFWYVWQDLEGLP